jgi:hypothetical protein
MKNKKTNIVAVASYRAGCKLEYNGKYFDYTHKKEVVYSEILLCDNAPKEFADRQTLWERVEESEEKTNGRRAKEIEMSLPNKLPLDTCKKIVREYAKQLTEQGLIVDYSIHWKENNHHIHLLSTTRPMNENGDFVAKSKKVYMLDNNGERIPLIDKTTGKQKVDNRNRKQWKTRKEEYSTLNQKEFLKQLRKSWANECNKYLEKENQITEKSHEQRIKDGELPEGIEPLKYVSRYDKEQEKKGIITQATQENIDIREHNKNIFSILEQIKNIVNEKVNDIQDRLAKLKQRRSESERERVNGNVGTTTNGQRELDKGKQQTQRKDTSTNWRDAVNERANREDERERQRIAREQEIERRNREREKMERDKKERERKERERAREESTRTQSESHGYTR